MSDKPMHATDDRTTRLLRQSALEIQRLRNELRKAEAVASEPIAIIGAGIRLPGGADNLDSLWNMLAAEHDAIGSVPDDRFGARNLGNAGFIQAMNFDAEFFRIGPEEARSLDPQHRLLLESSWTALESAAIVPRSLLDSTTGVFVGVSPSGYGWGTESNVFALTGQTPAFAASRLAHFLGLRGPTFVVDATCASGLVALHLATRALRNRECTLALASSVNVLANSDGFDFSARAGMTASDGRTKTFSSEATGFGRGEGVVTLALATLATAQARGYPILGIIRGSAVNHCGAGSSLIAPNGTSQRELLGAALTNAGLEPADVSYVECHGTGTKLGDAIEVQALGDVYASRAQAGPLLVGTIKTRIGHLEAASGLAGVVAVLAAMQHEALPASLHTSPRNTDIDWNRLPIEVVDTARPWPTNSKPRRAGVSAFSLSGTNAHVILEEPPHCAATPSEGRLELPLLLSARNQNALREQVRRLVQWLNTHPRASVIDVLYTLAQGRTHFTERLAIIVPAGNDGFPSDIVQSLEGFAKEGHVASCIMLGRVAHRTEGAAIEFVTADQVTSLARAWTEGAPANWTPLFPPKTKFVQDLPTYAFQRTRHWLDMHEPNAVSSEASNPVVSLGNSTESSAESELLRIWRDIFGIADLGLHDNFLMLGGTSLVGAEIVRRAAEVGLILQPRDLLRYPTIAELAAALTTTSPLETRDSCLTALRPTGSEIPLFFAPSLEGNAWILRELTNALRHSLPVWSFNEGELARRKTLPDSIGALASKYVDDLLEAFPNLPSYRIAGYSFGCSVAVEMARELALRGHTVSHILLLDGPPTLQAPSTFVPSKVVLWGFMQDLRLPGHTRDDVMAMEIEAIIDLIRDFLAQRNLPLIVGDPLQFIHIMLEVAQHNWNLLGQWAPKPFEQSVTLFRVATEYFDSPDLGWSKVISGEVNVVPVPGDHFTMVSDPFASALAACIERQLGQTMHSRTNIKMRHQTT